MSDAKYDKVLTKVRAEVSDLEVAMEELMPAYKAFEAEHLGIIKPLAEKYSTTRIFLAAEDTANYEWYPWLEGKLSPEELAAVPRVKSLMQDYAKRAEAEGMDTIQHRPFMHHAFHPSWDSKSAEVLMKKLDISTK